jgi:anti-sigma factor RsiW
MNEKNMNDDELSGLIRRHATQHKAGEQLRASVRTQVALQAAARAERPIKADGHWWNFRWGGQMAGFAGGVLLTLALGWLAPRVMLQNSLPDELVAGHVRALKAGALFEVASSDRHTVKPWFQGKLDYAPPVADLSADGFVLIGGRIDHIASRPVAALAYASRQHIVNVFVWPVDKQIPPQTTERSGFNVLHWNEGGMQLWVVSDVEAAELDRFGQAWRARTAQR